MGQSTGVCLPSICDSQVGVLNKLHQSSGVVMTLTASFWSQKEWFLDILELLVDFPVVLSLSKDLLREQHFHRFHLNLPVLQTDCKKNIQWFAKHSGLSQGMARKLVICKISLWEYIIRISGRFIVISRGHKASIPTILNNSWFSALFTWAALAFCLGY